jgi:PKD repeat protein
MGSAVGSQNFDVQCFNGNSYTFSTGADDTLTQSGSVFTGSNGAFGNAEDARGRAFYTGSGSFGIYQLARQPDGTLAPFPAPLVASPGQVQALSADPDGTALTAATGSNGFETYRIGADGSLAAGPAMTAVSMSPPQFLAYSPQQSPRAAFTATQTANGATSFAAGASQALGGSVVSRYDWDFGDGSSLDDGGQSVSHAYASPGDYTATLTVTDSAGCSVAGTHNGSRALCSGSPGAAVSHAVHVGAGASAPLTTAGVTPATRSASELRPTGATAAATVTGRKVLLSWAMAGSSGSETYRIDWSTLHSAHGPGDPVMHHLRISGRMHVLLRARPHSTVHFAVYAYRANGSLTPGTKTTLRLPR